MTKRALVEDDDGRSQLLGDDRSLLGPEASWRNKRLRVCKEQAELAHREDPVRHCEREGGGELGELAVATPTDHGRVALHPQLEPP